MTDCESARETLLERRRKAFHAFMSANVSAHAKRCTIDHCECDPIDVVVGREYVRENISE